MNIEEEFFKTFEIEPKSIEKAVGRGYYIEHSIEEYYPTITNKTFLELICIHNTYIGRLLYSLTVKDLKKEVLENLILEQQVRSNDDNYSTDLIQQVQKLFKL